MYRKELFSTSSDSDLDFKVPDNRDDGIIDVADYKEPSQSTDRVLNLWLERGILYKDEQGNLKIDLNNLKAIDIGIKNMTRGSLLEELSKIQVLDDSGIEEGSGYAKKPLVKLPQSAQDLYNNPSEWSKNWVLPFRALVPINIRSELTIHLASGEIVPLRQLAIAEGMSDFGAVYNPERSEHENSISLQALKKLSKYGVVTKQDGGPALIDKSCLYDLNLRDFGYGGAANIIEALSQVEGVDIEEYRAFVSKHYKLGPEHLPAIAIPRSIYEMFPERGSLDPSIISLWDLGAKFDWSRDLILESGEVVNIAEIAICYGLKMLDASRDEQTGQLMITTKEGKRVPFRNKVFCQNTGINPKVQDNKVYHRNIDFEHYGTDFLAYLPRLKKAGILEYSDFFRIDTGTNDFNVAPKIPSQTGDVGFTSEDGLFARYYLGKKKPFFLKAEPSRRDNHDSRKISGDVTNKDVMVYRLTSDSAGIFITTHGRKELIATFDFPRKDVIEAKYKEIMEIKGVDQKKAAPHVRFNKNEMLAMIKPYRFYEGITRWSDETDKQFMERTARLDRPDFVVTTCQEIFHEARIGLQKLDWEDQLKVADAVLQIPDREKLINFAKQFGVDGVRSLVSFNQTRIAKENIFKIVEKFGVEYGRKLFEKYSELLDLAKSVEQSIGELPERLNSSNLELHIKQGISNRGKKLLDHSLSLENTDELVSALDMMKTELIILGQLANALSKDGNVNLEELRGFSADTIPTSVMSEKERQEIEKLFIKNKEADPYFVKKGSLEAGIAELHQDLSPESKAYFHTYKFNSELAAYIKVKPISETEMYVGSFNADPEVRGSIPKILAEEIIITYGLQYDLVANAISGSPTERWYIQSYGFKPTGEVEEFGGVKYSKLIRPMDRQKAVAASAS